MCPQGEAVIQLHFLSLRCLYSWLRMVWLIEISKPADYRISHLFSISALQIHANGGLCPNVISRCCKSILQWASRVWQRFLHKENKHRIGRKQREEAEHCMKYFHCQFVLKTGLRYALCEAFLAFSETARASVKVLGEMSTTDTVVPTRFAFWNFTTDSGYWQRGADKISPD